MISGFSFLTLSGGQSNLPDGGEVFVYGFRKCLQVSTMPCAQVVVDKTPCCIMLV